MHYCLQTLLAGGEEVEILIINDGSKDNTARIADQYALRLFNRLGLTTATTYKALREECMPLVADISLETCQEWHAVIDEHGKAYRRGNTDERWLLQ